MITPNISQQPQAYSIVGLKYRTISLSMLGPRALECCAQTHLPNMLNKMASSLLQQGSFTKIERYRISVIFVSLLSMRITAILFASYISFLTVQPMVSPVQACEKKTEVKSTHRCCEKNQASGCEKQEPGKCPSSGICNPFGQCTCCLAAPEPSFFEFSKSTLGVDFTVLTSANLISTYMADCFRPPEVV